MQPRHAHIVPRRRNSSSGGDRGGCEGGDGARAEMPHRLVHVTALHWGVTCSGCALWHAAFATFIRPRMPHPSPTWTTSPRAAAPIKEGAVGLDLLLEEGQVALAVVSAARRAGATSRPLRRRWAQRRGRGRGAAERVAAEALAAQIEGALLRKPV